MLSLILPNSFLNPDQRGRFFSATLKLERIWNSPRGLVPGQRTRPPIEAQSAPLHQVTTRESVSASSSHELIDTPSRPSSPTSPSPSFASSSSQCTVHQSQPDAMSSTGSLKSASSTSSRPRRPRSPPSMFRFDMPPPKQPKPLPKIEKKPKVPKPPKPPKPAKEPKPKEKLAQAVPAPPASSSSKIPKPKKPTTFLGSSLRSVKDKKSHGEIPDSTLRSVPQPTLPTPSHPSSSILSAPRPTTPATPAPQPSDSPVFPQVDLRHRRMEKLTRTLGEPVPRELIFPPIPPTYIVTEFPPPPEFSSCSGPLPTITEEPSECLRARRRTSLSLSALTNLSSLSSLTSVLRPSSSAQHYRDTSSTHTLAQDSDSLFTVTTCSTSSVDLLGSSPSLLKADLGLHERPTVSVDTDVGPPTPHLSPTTADSLSSPPTPPSVCSIPDPPFLALDSGGPLVHRLDLDPEHEPFIREHDAEDVDDVEHAHSLGQKYDPLSTPRLVHTSPSHSPSHPPHLRSSFRSLIPVRVPASKKAKAGGERPSTPFVDSLVPVQPGMRAPTGVCPDRRAAVVRRERREGWSGEWNLDDMQDVIQKLRSLK